MEELKWSVDFVLHGDVAEEPAAHFYWMLFFPSLIILSFLGIVEYLWEWCSFKAILNPMTKMMSIVLNKLPHKMKNDVASE